MAANKRKADTTIDKPRPAKRAKAVDEATINIANQTSAPEATASVSPQDNQDEPDTERGPASEKVSATEKTPRRRNKLAPPRPWPTVARADSATGPRSAHKEGKNYICITRKTNLGAYLRRCKDLVLKDGYKTLHLSAMGAAIPHLVQLSVALPPILPYDASEIHSEITTGTIHVHDEIVPDDEDEKITYEKRGKSTLMVVMKIGDGEYEGNDRSKSLERRRRGKRTQAQVPPLPLS
ncbi:hypothetical protein EV121DRAFT_206990 [Schizophyllum commune]